MLKFSPCLEIFFKDLPFVERIEKTASLGYNQFEFWTWWNKDVDAIKKTAEKHQIKVAAFCTKFVSLVNPDNRSDYLIGLKQTLDVAEKLNADVIISQVGNEIKDVSREKQHQALIDGLKASAELMEKSGQILAIEPLNILYDHKGYYLSRSDEAAEIIRAVGSEKVRMLFDVYHQQISEGNLINNIRDHFNLIGHFHIADHPGRHEIGTGEINYPVILQEIENLGFKGFVGIELFPLNKNHEEVLSNKLFFSFS